MDPARTQEIVKAFADPGGENVMGVLSGSTLLREIGLSQKGNQIIDQSHLTVPGPNGFNIRGCAGFFPDAIITVGPVDDVLLSQAM